MFHRIICVSNAKKEREKICKYPCHNVLGADSKTSQVPVFLKARPKMLYIARLLQCQENLKVPKRGVLTIWQSGGMTLPIEH